MATDILLNDGGAPARILPFVAAEDVTAGNLLTVDVAGKVQNASSADPNADMAGIGYALTTISSGNIASVITGHGVVLNINSTDNVAGIALMMGPVGAPGRMVPATNVATGPMCQAVCLEDTNAVGLHRSITV